MKKILIGIILISSFFSLMACSHKEEKLVYLGVEAKILSVNYNDKELTIIGVEDGKKILQMEVKINCKNLEEDNKIFKVGNSTELKYIKFSDLKVTDKIKINVSKKELDKEDSGIINVEQIELIEKN